jgi:hypothetical protein
MEQKIAEHPSAKLLVEGNDEFHVLQALFKHYNVEVRNKKNPQSGLFSIKDSKSIDSLLESIPIELKMVDTLGIIIDSDVEIKNHWISVKNRFKKIGYILPKHLDENGCVIELEDKKIGIWIMPNNSENGMLEDFIKFLIPIEDQLLPIAEKVINDIENEKLQKYKGTYRSKALIHTWLAWQKRPGTSMGQAVTNNYLKSNELSDRFINWINKLFVE